MKTQFHIKKVASMLPILGLAVLLLFSPCKVRNFIQSGLDLQQTQVLNKSKSTFSYSTCQSFEIATSTLVKEDQNASKLLALELEPSDDKPQAYNVGYSNNKSSPDYQSNPGIPLYILYKRLIVFG